MKKFSFFLSALSMLVAMVSFNACSDDDDPTPDKPTVVVPSGIQQVAVTVVKDMTFTVDIPGGYMSSSFQTAGGTFVPVAPMTIEEGAKSGTITGAFTAGDVVGAGAVTLTVTDKNGKTDTGTIAINIVD